VKVYLVTFDDECQGCNSYPGGVKIVGIFDSRDKADAAAEFVNHRRASELFSCNIDEVDVS
jgi:hypothetical protein